MSKTPPYLKITSLNLSGDTFARYKGTDGNALSELRPLSKVNLLVGPNNSGKSRFMRGMSGMAPFEVDLENEEWKEFQEFIKTALGTIKVQVGTARDHVDPLFPKSKDFSFLPLGMDIGSSLLNELQEFPAKFDALGAHNTNWAKGKPQSFFGRYIENNYWRYKTFRNGGLQSQTPKSVYVPTTRGLRDIAEGNDVFRRHIHMAYFGDNKLPAPNEIFTGLQLYDQVKNMLLGPLSERHQIALFQEFLRDYLFSGNEVTVIPMRRTKDLYVKIGQEKERPIYDLGDGIQALIILTFLPFMTEFGFFFIEEPELHLHPGMQRKLLELYTRSEWRHVFFLSTHSNHLLDMTLDYESMSVFTFKKELEEGEEDEKEPTFTVTHAGKGDESPLALLGARASSVFLVNATIWVEGITDRLYLRKYLDLYQKLHEEEEGFVKVHEDQHYSFVEYGGANLVHWGFLDSEEPTMDPEKVCSAAMVIADRDGQKKIEKHKRLRIALDDRYVQLQAREIENTLPVEVIHAVVRYYEKDEQLKFPDRKESLYRERYLGRFIDQELLRGNPNREGGYGTKSGTVKRKTEFCKKALTFLEEEHLNGEVRRLAESMYVFVCKANEIRNRSGIE